MESYPRQCRSDKNLFFEEVINSSTKPNKTTQEPEKVFYSPNITNDELAKMSLAGAANLWGVDVNDLLIDFVLKFDLNKNYDFNTSLSSIAIENRVEVSQMRSLLGTLSN